MAVLPLVIILGSFQLASYSTQPGQTGDVARRLDNKAFTEMVPGVKSHDGKFRVLIAYHPHCPCTVAAIRNLQRMQTRISKPHIVCALAYLPKGNSKDWISSTNSNEIQNLSNVQTIVDCNGQISSELGIKTSGHVLIYSPDGELLFSGGITPGRGHEGDCPASESVISAINDRSSERIRWPVFGCPFE